MDRQKTSKSSFFFFITFHLFLALNNVKKITCATISLLASGKYEKFCFDI